MTNLVRTILNPSTVTNPLGAYSHSVTVSPGKLLFIAGQVAVDRNGNPVGAGDVKAQTRQVFQNLAGVLSGAGASFSNVVEFTTYLVGREAVQPFIEARTEIFPTIYPCRDYPPNTLLIISGLVREDFLVEIKAVAALP